VEKKVKSAVAAKPAPKKGSRGGRPKERVQVSVRFDRVVMDLLRDYLDRNKKAHITDLLERGALLAVREAERLKPEYINALVSLNDVGVELARDVTKMWKMRYLAAHRELTPVEACLREVVISGLASVNDWPGSEEALRLVTDPNIMLADRNQFVHGMSKPQAQS
jgi:hypothetical protein